MVDLALARGPVVSRSGRERRGVNASTTAVLSVPKATWAPCTTGPPRVAIQKNGFWSAGRPNPPTPSMGSMSRVILSGSSAAA